MNKESAVINNRIPLLASLIVMIGLFGANTANATDPVYTKLFSNVALGGYDAVSYFSQDGPIKGKKSYRYEYNGALWYFSTNNNKTTFIAAPERYAPQYGGHCAWAVSQNYTASGDPKVWKIVDGRLYLNYNEDVAKDWLQDIPGFIRKANANWPAVLDN